MGFPVPNLRRWNLNENEIPNNQKPDYNSALNLGVLPSLESGVPGHHHFDLNRMVGAVPDSIYASGQVWKIPEPVYLGEIPLSEQPMPPPRTKPWYRIW